MGCIVNGFDIADIERRVGAMVGAKRLRHIRGVADTAAALARRYGEDERRAVLAAYLHDAFRDMDDKTLLSMARAYDLEVDEYTRAHPSLLHGPLAATFAQRELGVDDEAVLDAVRGHTTGDERMEKLTCILYLADCTEPNRNYEGVECLRDAAQQGLYEATRLAVEQCRTYLDQRGQQPHPATTLAAKALAKRIEEDNI
jgi:predicted HD superfamily hydrolase involved in NAD metabolism